MAGKSRGARNAAASRSASTAGGRADAKFAEAVRSARTERSGASATHAKVVRYASMGGAGRTPWLHAACHLLQRFRGILFHGACCMPATLLWNLNMMHDPWRMLQRRFYMHPLPAQVRLHRVWRQLDLLARPSAHSVQGVRRLADLRTQSDQERLQRLRRARPRERCQTHRQSKGQRQRPRLAARGDSGLRRGRA